MAFSGIVKLMRVTASSKIWDTPSTPVVPLPGIVNLTKLSDMGTQITAFFINKTLSSFFC
jgi:hypothetical protein